MNTKPSQVSLSGALALAALSAAAFSVVVGCSKSEAAPARPALAVTEQATVVSASAKADTDTYVAEMVAGGSYNAGAEGTVEITLAIKPGYHINKQYPYKFKVSEPLPDGVTFPKPLLVRADGTFDDAGTSLSFKLPFTVAKPGKVTIAGTLSISACSDANCIMDKQTLAREVDVN